MLQSLNYLSPIFAVDFCGSMGYCEFRIKHLLKEIKPPQTELTIAGTKAHEMEEEYEKELEKIVRENSKTLFGEKTIT